MALTKLTATTTATTVLASNVSRAKGGLILQNTDANPCYVLLGDVATDGTVSATNFSFSLAQNNPVGITDCKNAVQAVWGTAAGGQLLVTEYIN